MDFAFQDIGLDRAEPIRNHPAQLDAYWPDARVLCLDAQAQACCLNAETIYFTGRALAQQRPVQASFLGMHQDQAYFLFCSDLPLSASLHSVGIRAAAVLWSAFDAAVFAQAKALWHWQSQAKFCSRCGTAMQLQNAGFSAACAACALVVYPNAHPAVIMQVSDGKHILLGRQASWPEKRWSVLAGFVEPGESPEQTVVREVWEEAGVKVTHVQYIASQPWPMPMALMLGFSAYAPYQAVQVGDELQEARWFSAAQLRQALANEELELSPKLSISRYLIDIWLAAQPE